MTAAEQVDLTIVGAGAAGLFAAIHAGRAAPSTRIVAVDRARKLGAKVLVAGGGRCNVTHHAVEPARGAPRRPRGRRPAEPPKVWL